MQVNPSRASIILPDEIINAIQSQEKDSISYVIQFILNEVMKIERECHLGVGPYQRGKDRNGQSNGFKPKKLLLSSGEIDLFVPQVRDSSFYPQSIIKGQRSEKALRPAIAEMYICRSSLERFFRASNSEGFAWSESNRF